MDVFGDGFDIREGSRGRCDVTTRGIGATFIDAIKKGVLDVRRDTRGVR